MVRDLHLLLKFNHGVEIGARLAYLGHLRRTGETGIRKIIQDEEDHRRDLQKILACYNQRPSPIIDGFFFVVGSLIRGACAVSPPWLLDAVARSMEVFAVASYEHLAGLYPHFEGKFKGMAAAECEHERYFSRAPTKPLEG